MPRAPRFTHFEIVTVDNGDESMTSPVGTVLGIALPDVESDEISYSVLLEDDEQCVMVDESRLSSTGTFASPSDHYDGSSLRITQEGEVRSEDD